MKAKITYTYKFDPSQSEYWSHETEKDMLKVLTSNLEAGFRSVYSKHKCDDKICDFTYNIKHGKNTFDMIIESDYPINRCEEFLEDLSDDCFDDLRSQFSGYYSKHSISIDNWIEVETKTKTCVHVYKHLQFIPCGSKVMEIKQCTKCDETFTFDVKKGKI